MIITYGMCIKPFGMNVMMVMYKAIWDECDMTVIYKAIWDECDDGGLSHAAG